MYECVYVRERRGGRVYECVYVREREEYECVCVCERERGCMNVCGCV